MATRPDEPYYRQWLHAMEDDRSVPGTAMQVARIFADYAASRGETTTSVSWAALQRQTHRSTDAISQAIRYLLDYEWLEPHPRKSRQRAVYSLTLGTPSKPSKLLRPSEQSGPAGYSGYRSTTTPATGVQPLRLPEQSGSGEYSGHRSTTTPATGAQPLRSSEHERLTSATSLSGIGELHAALSAAVPDVTERETELALAEIQTRPGVRSAVAVLRTEINNGGAPGLIAKIRSDAAATQPSALPPLCGECDNRWIYDDQGGLMHCPRCHPQARIRDRQST